MRLIVAHNSISKMAPETTSYIDLRKFIQNSFHEIPKKWVVQYKDTQGDMITVASQTDFQNMLDTNTGKYLKVNVVEGQYSAQYIFLPKDQDEISIPSKIQPSCEKIEKSVNQQEPIKVQDQQRENMDQWKQCHEKKAHWREQMKQRVTKYIDQRIQSLIPCLTKQIQQRLREKASQKPIKKSSSDVVHEVICQGCKVSPIVGIRYKCSQCINFNLCEICQVQIQHKHNMMKMKNKEEIKEIKENKQQEKPFWGMGKCGKGFGRWHHGDHHGSPHHHKRSHEGHPPPPFGFPGMMFPPGFPFHHQNQQNQKSPKISQQKCQIKDVRLKLIKKCFKMSQRLGGQPEIYEEFVKERLDKKVPQIVKEWIAAKNIDGKKFDEKQIERKSSKLGLYYKKDPSQFKELVKNNLGCKVPQLIKMIQSQNNSQMKKIQPKQEIKIQEQKKQAKVQEKKEQLKPIKIEQDLKKKESVILEFKDLFGEESVAKYNKFYEQNSHLTKQQIVEKYLTQNLQ